jgi:hypothetical protein
MSMAPKNNCLIRPSVTVRVTIGVRDGVRVRCKVMVKIKVRNNFRMIPRGRVGEREVGRGRKKR